MCAHGMAGTKRSYSISGKYFGITNGIEVSKREEGGMKYWFILEHGWTLTLGQVNEARHKRSHITEFHLYKMSRVAKP